jgi:hypothetical protein
MAVRALSTAERYSPSQDRAFQGGADPCERRGKQKTEGIESFQYTGAELERISAFRNKARTGARAIFQSICQSAAAPPH